MMLVNIKSFGFVDVFMNIVDFCGQCFKNIQLATMFQDFVIDVNRSIVLLYIKCSIFFFSEWT